MLNIKSYSKNFYKLFKNNLVFFLVLLFCSTTFLFCVSLSATNFDKQISNEITEQITDEAYKSKFGFSLNELTMKEKGNSDYWIFSDNKLQNFQMQNQTKTTEKKNYIFSAYTPYQQYTPFKYNNYSCSTILFESMFKDNAFYFDLPLRAGNFQRYTDKQSIYITDKFASNIFPSKQPSELIGNVLNGKIITPRRSDSNIAYVIKGVLDTNNNLGNFLMNSFGENLIFVTEHNVVPMTNHLYFCGCKDKGSNNSMVNFVTENYNDSKGASGGLETGYDVNYKFYELNDSTKQILGKQNKKLNDIINTYKDKGTMLSIIGITLSILMFIFIVAILIKEKRKYIIQGKGSALFSFWMISCVSLIVVSLLYSYLPIVSIICKQSFLTRSTVTSTVIMLAWILLTLILSIFPFAKLKLIKKNIN